MEKIIKMQESQFNEIEQRFKNMHDLKMNVIRLVDFTGRTCNSKCNFNFSVHCQLFDQKIGMQVKGSNGRCVDCIIQFGGQK